MPKKIYFLSLCLLAVNLNGAESPAHRSPHYSKHATITALTVAVAMTTPGVHGCPAAPMATTKTSATVSSAAEAVMNNVRDFSLARYPWLGSDAKFRAAYPDWRPEFGDTCESIPNSNQTLVCYNQPRGTGAEECITKVFKDYIKTRGFNPKPLEPAVFAKRERDLKQAGEDCLKKREFRYQPKKSDYRRKGAGR